MEYRRRKRRRRPGSGTKGISGNSAKMIAVLLVIAAVVYLISASAVGTWIAEKVFAPVFETIDGWFKNTPAPTPSLSPSSTLPELAADENGARASADTLTTEIDFPSMECFALQMGVYSNQSNAEQQAQLLKQRGAGGYVLEEDGRYRVLAAAYTSQDSLKQVREQLKAEGLESAAYTFTSAQSTLRITATQEQLEGIAMAFNALKSVQEELLVSSLSFDQEKQTAAQGREISKTLLTKLMNAKETFESLAASEHPVLSATQDCFSAYEEALSVLANYPTENFVDFSSKIKYTNIGIIAAYNRLAKSITMFA